MTMIIPGAMMKCVRSLTCGCGYTSVTEGALYMCEALGAPLLHGFVCDVPGCDGCLIVARGKECGVCAIAFAPLNDGDTSLVADELEDDGPLRGPRIDRIWEDEAREPDTTPSEYEPA